jgi:hypothetical protein
MKHLRDNSILFYTLTAISIFLIFVVAYANTYVNMDTELYVRPETFIPYTTYPSNKILDTPSSKFDINPGTHSAATSFVPLNGFQGLQYNYLQENTANPKDVFATAQGSLSCESFGLMNSKGPLCLDANQIKLYTTRGGNASDVASSTMLSK